MSDEYGLIPVGTFAALYEYSEAGYRIRVGSLSGRELCDKVDAKDFAGSEVKFDTFG